MAEPLPAALRIPEVSRFINRAHQLRAIKPAIAYWCASPPPVLLQPLPRGLLTVFANGCAGEYHAVNQIVGRSLHTADDDCFAFTKTLIERLEVTKAEHAADDAIVDNDAGQAYVEQFAHETFARAERTLRANKVTRQTADTFDAAATFFDLTHEWGTPDAETLQKIKFAKWNAARILRAIREGRDPNESNPQPATSDAEPPLSPDDPDVRALMGPGVPPPASVEDAPDAGDAAALPLPRMPPPAVQEGYLPPGPSTPPPPAPPDFAPSPMSQSPAPETTGILPPPTQFSHPAPTQIPPQPSPQIPTKLPSQFAPPPEPRAAPDMSHPPPSWASAPGAPPPAAPPSAPVYVPAMPPPVPAAAVGAEMNLRDINQAQKHAKWAISALNFEDVPTAVAELRNALAMLGAQ
ncbi:Vacuolar protein sorting-associated protein vts1 [Tolypocladium ophioglossoides CBS 100239]|uniref:Vacuolar protein sorting-associated protein vts1 n=1 Tax=Tolypocladium ophioglossoides (strain CBS 100239) TaxID=1163406 RepID=A0A0L0NAI0_TOLOC|nr:Vacuolar protein sorting-associated protein vts1 [Tolypocladium ophioglossoides CBS 100239]